MMVAMVNFRLAGNQENLVGYLHQTSGWQECPDATKQTWQGTCTNIRVAWGLLQTQGKPGELRRILIPDLGVAKVDSRLNKKPK